MGLVEECGDCPAAAVVVGSKRSLKFDSPQRQNLAEQFESVFAQQNKQRNTEHAGQQQKKREKHVLGKDCWEAFFG